jgi:hypothetical protein
MVMLINDSKILIEPEDGACQQERLRHIIEQPASHIVDLDHLISHERDAAHDKQHRTGILRDFEAFLVFHGIRYDPSEGFLDGGTTCCTQDESDDVTDRLKDSFNSLVHNALMF